MYINIGTHLSKYYVIYLYQFCIKVLNELTLSPFLNINMIINELLEAKYENRDLHSLFYSIASIDISV